MAVSEVNYFSGGGVLQKITLNGTAGGNMTTPANAFDGNPATKSYATGSSGGYLTYQFSTAQKVNIFGFRGNTDAPPLSPPNIVVSASNDGGSTWTIIAVGGCNADTEIRYCCTENDTAYTLYKFDCTARNGGGSIGYYAQVSEIEMYYLDGLKFS